MASLGVNELIPSIIDILVITKFTGMLHFSNQAHIRPVSSQLSNSDTVKYEHGIQ